MLSLLMTLCLVGCATSDTATSNRPGAKQIAVYQAANPPTQKYIVIRTLKDDAAEVEEDEVTEKFIKDARKLGGDAIIFHEKKPSGMEVEPFGFGKINNTFLYRVDVIRFE